MLIALILGTWVALNLVAIWCYARLRRVRTAATTMHQHIAQQMTAVLDVGARKAPTSD
ncbi:MAG: hypothetical protein ACREPT_06955 [Rudaea sp.]